MKRVQNNQKENCVPAQRLGRLSVQPDAGASARCFGFGQPALQPWPGAGPSCWQSSLGEEVAVSQPPGQRLGSWGMGAPEVGEAA